MKSTKAIFKKQIKDIMKNSTVLIMFFLFPAVAFAFDALVDVDIPYGNMGNVTIMMAAAFAGMGLIPTVAGIVAEDRETKSLRFLVMAGVKPMSYLLGVGGVVLILGLISSLAFTLIGGFSGQDFLIFLTVMMLSVAASIILGLTIGIYAKNHQAATGLSMPAAMILGFGPMISTFNETVARGFNIFYTQQLNVVTDSFAEGNQAFADHWQSFAIIGANIAVLAVFFIIAYAKKGMKS